MTDDELSALRNALILGIAMRRAQVRYFKTRDHSDLVASKEAERAFDRAANAVMADVERVTGKETS